MKKTCLRYLPGAFCLAAFLAIVFTIMHPALADAPQPWRLGLQDPASPSMDRIYAFHQKLLYVISAITAFVFILMAWVILRYNKWMNPVPSKTTHNVKLEIVWSVLPALILLALFVPSMQLLYYTDRTTEPQMTLKITGYQWYWGYEYQNSKADPKADLPDADGLTFTSYLIKDEDIDASKGQKRLLSVDNPVYLPVNTNIQLLITASDVIHSFAVPALGVKLDAVPGRLNETWFKIERPGVYYGQCSELCGVGHGFMPIEIHAVSLEEYKEWVAAAKKQFADAANPTIKLANVEEVQ